MILGIFSLFLKICQVAHTGTLDCMVNLLRLECENVELVSSLGSAWEHL